MCSLPSDQSGTLVRQLPTPSGDINLPPRLPSRRLSHLKQVLGWLFMHLSGKAVPKSSPRFSEDTVIAFLSTAGDAFATMEYHTLLLSVITGATGEERRRK